MSGATQTSKVIFMNKPNPERFAWAYEWLLKMQFEQEYPGVKVTVMLKKAGRSKKWIT